MPTTFQAEDYVLRWPREHFRRRLAELINAQQQPGAGWADQVDLLLDDAFDSDQPAEAFRSATNEVPDPWDSNGTVVRGGVPPNRQFLIDMLRAADTFPHEVQRRPYRSQRGRTDRAAVTISLSAAVARFINLINDLDDRGYFERSFQKDCVDDARSIDPSVLIEEEIGEPNLWPLSVDRLTDRLEVFLDLIEVLGEFVAAPQSRSMHSFGGCGWHHRDFNIQMGRDLYFWWINQLLGKTSLELQLATSGEDRGRLVETHGDARNDLVAATIDGASVETRNPIEHAVSLFRRRGVTVEDKRSACTTLAGVLEFRRSLLKKELYRRDEGALFQIANEFDVRHRTESQKGDYDPVFLDWIFWWYLGTIELTDRLIARQSQT